MKSFFFFLETHSKRNQDGQVGEWKASDCSKWAREAKLPDKFVTKLQELNIPGPLLVALTDDELNELGIDTPFMRHKFHYELDVARKKETQEAVATNVGGDDTGIVGSNPATTTDSSVVSETTASKSTGTSTNAEEETQTNSEKDDTAKDENEESIHGTYHLFSSLTHLNRS